jgi:hypothetical protein
MQSATPPSGNPPNNSTASSQAAQEVISNFTKRIDESYSNLLSRTKFLVSEFDKMSAQMAGTFGQTQMAIKGLTVELAVATPLVVGLGGSLSDVQNIQRGIAQSLNTNVITLGETVGDLYAAGQAVGIDSGQIGDMVKGFQDAGIQTGNIKENIQLSVDIARKVGVNTSAVFGLVRDNLSNINKYGFENGVAGLAKMSAQAASLRINMNEIFGFAERVFNPEGAVEMVSAFQRLGVAAGDLADPFRLMYLASEDTAELQNQVAKMTEKFTYFDEKTKSFKVFPNAKRDLREIEKETGIAYNDLIKMSEGQQKLNMIRSEFKTTAIDEESKQFIANVAQYNKERGGFTVKVGGMDKLVSEINPADLDEIKKSQETVTVEEIAKAQLDTNNLQLAALNKLVDSVAAPIAGSKAPREIREFGRAVTQVGMTATDKTIGNQRGAMASIDKFYDETGKSILDLLKGEGSPAKIAEVFKNAGADVQQSFSNIKQSITSIDFKSAIQPYVSSGNKIAEAADLAVVGLKKLAEKATASGTMTNKADANQSQSSNNQTIKVEDINYKGAIEIKVTTPNGSTSNLTDTQVYDLFKNETFIKQINKMISDGSVKGPYSAVPNNTR